MTKAQYKALQKQREKQRKQEDKARAKAAKSGVGATAADGSAAAEPGEHTVFVMDFEGDLQASKVEQLRKEITAVLTTAKAGDEVVIRLESAGGVVHGYGLAASQLHRIRDQGVELTVAVDKVAASGGYMMAAVANRIVAAPFAVVGSIGVVAQVPNVHRLLKRNDVDVDVLTAGKYKRTLTMLARTPPRVRRSSSRSSKIPTGCFSPTSRNTAAKSTSIRWPPGRPGTARRRWLTGWSMRCVRAIATWCGHAIARRFIWLNGWSRRSHWNGSWVNCLRASSLSPDCGVWGVGADAGRM